MSTRSYIGIKNGKTIEAIYCHRDGNPEYVGFILKKHYTTEEKVRELIALGGLSSLGAGGVACAYHRDMGYDDTFIPTRTIEGSSMTAFVKAVYNKLIEHVYLFDPKTSKWAHREM